MSEAQAWVLIITAVGGILITVISSIVTAVLTFLSRDKLVAIKERQVTDQAMNTTKLDVIHTSTNGGVTLLQQQNAALAAEIQSLKLALASTTGKVIP